MPKVVGMPDFMILAPPIVWTLTQSICWHCEIELHIERWVPSFDQDNVVYVCRSCQSFIASSDLWG